MVMMVSTKEVDTWSVVTVSVLHICLMLITVQLNCDGLCCGQVKVSKELWSF